MTSSVFLFPPDSSSALMQLTGTGVAGDTSEPWARCSGGPGAAEPSRCSGQCPLCMKKQRQSWPDCSCVAVSGAIAVHAGSPHPCQASSAPTLRGVRTTWTVREDSDSQYGVCASRGGLKTRPKVVLVVPVQLILVGASRPPSAGSEPIPVTTYVSLGPGQAGTSGVGFSRCSPRMTGRERGV